MSAARALTAYGTLGKFTWRMVAVVLAAEALVVSFGALVAWSLAGTGDAKDRANAYLLVGMGIAALAIVAAGLLRRPIGVTLGWLVQILALGSAVVVPIMLFVGGVFAALFITCLVQGHKLDSTVAGAPGEPVSGDSVPT